MKSYTKYKKDRCKKVLGWNFSRGFQIWNLP